LSNQLLGNLKTRAASFWLLFLLLIQKKSQQGIIFEVKPSRIEIVLTALHTERVFNKIEKEVVYV
jgi:hypothetical protein